MLLAKKYDNKGKNKIKLWAKSHFSVVIIPLGGQVFVKSNWAIDDVIERFWKKVM
jgi:hypothetical protein